MTNAQRRRVASGEWQTASGECDGQGNVINLSTIKSAGIAIKNDAAGDGDIAAVVSVVVVVVPGPSPSPGRDQGAADLVTNAKRIKLTQRKRRRLCLFWQRQRKFILFIC